LDYLELTVLQAQGMKTMPESLWIDTT